MHGIVLNEKNNPIIVGLMIVPPRDRAEAEAHLKEAISQLKQIYRQVPKTCCNQCGSCCDGTKTGNPWIHSVEYLNIMRFLSSPPNKKLKRRVYGSAMMGKALLERKIQQEPNSSSHFECTPFMPVCPALDRQAKVCLVYEYRPLVCRLYGLDGWSKGAEGWVKKEGMEGCHQLKISEQDQTKYWGHKKHNSLFEQLKQLSAYYYIDEAEGAIFNGNSITDWLALGLKG